jgi:hypothetical protein
MSEKRTLLHMLENLRRKRAWLAYDVKRSRLEEVMLCSKSDQDAAILPWVQISAQRLAILTLVVYVFPQACQFLSDFSFLIMLLSNKV